MYPSSIKNKNFQYKEIDINITSDVNQTLYGKKKFPLHPCVVYTFTSSYICCNILYDYESSTGNSSCMLEVVLQ